MSLSKNIVSQLNKYFESDTFEDRNSAEKSFKAFKLYLNDPSSKIPSKEAQYYYQDWKKFHNLKIQLDGKECYYTGSRITPSYIGLKNSVLRIYPKANIDIQIVYDGDKFEYGKTDKGIKYVFQSADPFSRKEMVGTFGYISTNDGSGQEVLETLNTEEIDSIRKLAQTDMFWKRWETESIKKSILKRVTTRLRDDDREFSELVQIDNEVVNGDLLEIGSAPGSMPEKSENEILNNSVVEEGEQGDGEN